MFISEFMMGIELNDKFFWAAFDEEMDEVWLRGMDFDSDGSFLRAYCAA